MSLDVEDIMMNEQLGTFQQPTISFIRNEERKNTSDIQVFQGTRKSKLAIPLLKTLARVTECLTTMRNSKYCIVVAEWPVSPRHNTWHPLNLMTTIDKPPRTSKPPANWKEGDHTHTCSTVLVMGNTGNEG